jgi:hypothetical protein
MQLGPISTTPTIPNFDGGSKRKRSMSDRLTRVVEMFTSRGNISDDVEGDVHTTAGEWLQRAQAELEVLEPILTAGHWRVAYNTAYDIYRHAAESVDLVAGYRILASKGAHVATFAVASAALDGHSDVFDSVTASTMSGTRNRLEYLDASNPVEVAEGEARWAVQLAERAVDDAGAFLRRSSGKT